jgi:predicted metal-dependent RNase
MSVRRVLFEVLPEAAIVERVDFSEDGAAVTLWTRNVGLLLGRRGVTADRIRTAIDGWTASKRSAKHRRAVTN